MRSHRAIDWRASGIEAWHTMLTVLVVLAVCIAICGPASAQTRKKAAKSGKTPATSEESKSRKGGPSPETTGPADYTSKNFLVHTDLRADEARELLTRLETMLALISKYWDRPPSGIIECYVVKDLRKWPPGSIDPIGLDSIEAGAGVTSTRTVRLGNAFVAKSTVYAVADRGTPQHEAVHAYCGQAFGRTGPVWYAEGMAEMGQYWQEKDPSVNAHEGVIEYLRRSEPKSLNEIVNSPERTGDSWQNYAWRWALCHLLANNSNYSPRFRPLGLDMLTRDESSFEDVYGSMAQEITFEYLLFLKHLEKGFRADLCSWDWKAKFKKSSTGTVVQSIIDAGRGWQASKLFVVQGEEYEYSASGTWSTGKGVSPMSADGGSVGVGSSGDANQADGKPAAGKSGSGKLVGILFEDYTLSQPFELGTFGSFVAPGDGNLFLRCEDSWSEIADNKGKITVRLKVKGKGNPLAPPKSEGEKERPK